MMGVEPPINQLKFVIITSLLFFRGRFRGNFCKNCLHFLYGRKTENYALIRAELSKGMKLVEDCAKEASDEIGAFIFRGVTEGISYTQLRMLDGLPCGQDMYYDRYRHFFYILSQKRGL